MRMTGDPTVAEAELFKIGKDGRVRNVGREQWDERQPGKNAACHQNTGDSRADNVSNTKIFRRDLAAHTRAWEARGTRGEIPGNIFPEAQNAHQRFIEKGDAQAREKLVSHRAAPLSSAQQLR